METSHQRVSSSPTDSPWNEKNVADGIALSDRSPSGVPSGRVTLPFLHMLRQEFVGVSSWYELRDSFGP
jgi:hypothetical protein